MDQPIVRYRVLVTLVTLAVSVALIAGNHLLPAAYQIAAWGMAIGLLSTFAYVALTWFFDVSLYLIIVVMPPISLALRYAFGFGFGYPRGNYYWLGEGIGLVTMIAITLVLPLRRSSLSRPQRRAMPPLEDTSSHTLIVPRAREPRADKSGSPTAAS